MNFTLPTNAVPGIKSMCVTIQNGNTHASCGLFPRSNAPAGGTAVAVDAKHIYSWDAGSQTVYIYNLKGKFHKSIKLTQGDYGFSLAYAKDLLWI